MSDKDLTIGDLARHFDQPMWRLRKVVDSLPVEIPRVALYRIVPITLMSDIAAELERRGWVSEQHSQDEAAQ